MTPAAHRISGAQSKSKVGIYSGKRLSKPKPAAEPEPNRTVPLTGVTVPDKRIPKSIGWMSMRSVKWGDGRSMPPVKCGPLGDAEHGTERGKVGI